MTDSVCSEALDQAQCLALLATARIGRVVFTHRAMPAVQPVPFTFGDGCVFFGADPGSVLHLGTKDAVVAFEVDEFVLDLSTGWYVTLLGRAYETPSSAEGLQLRVPITSITGRRVGCGFP